MSETEKQFQACLRDVERTLRSEQEERNGITQRERFLMREAMKAAEHYGDLEKWLSEPVDDAGHTVEQHLSYDADNLKVVDQANKALYETLSN